MRRWGVWLGSLLVVAGCAFGGQEERMTGAWLPGDDEGTSSGDAGHSETSVGETDPGGGSDDAGDDEDDDGSSEGTDGGSTGAAASTGDAMEDGSSGESTGTNEVEPPPCPEPQMIHFPIAGPHNIGYDNPSCGTGTCEVSCPDINANSDWNGGAGHHGVDLFAHYQAPLLAVADAEVVAVGVVSDTSGLRVRIRDACGWEYYYGHLDEAMVAVGDVVTPGEQLGTMGATGTQSVHLHFNVSFEGNYSDDIDPFELLDATSPTACE